MSVGRVAVGVGRIFAIAEDTHLRPSDCRFCPLSVEMSTSFPRGWFEIVIVEESASGAVSRIL